MQNLSPQAVRIAAEQAKNWKLKLFTQALVDEIESYSLVREEHRQGTSSGPAIDLEFEEDQFLEWLSDEMERHSNIVAGYVRVIRYLSHSAFAGPGQAETDVEAALRLAREFGETYCHSLDWPRQFQEIRLPLPYQPLLEELARLSDNFIESIEQMPVSLSDCLAESDARSETEPAKITLNLNIDMAPRNMDAVHREIKILSHRLGATGE